MYCEAFGVTKVQMFIPRYQFIELTTQHVFQTASDHILKTDKIISSVEERTLVSET